MRFMGLSLYGYGAGKLIHHVVSFSVRGAWASSKEENDITFTFVQATHVELTASFSCAAVHFLYIVWFS